MTDKQNDWNQFQQNYPIGKEVEGAIIKKMPFGVFIDIGEQFLVLLELPAMQDLDYEKYQAEQQFKTGERVKGRVTDFTDHNIQMRIAQK